MFVITILKIILKKLVNLKVNITFLPNTYLNYKIVLTLLASEFIKLLVKKEVI